MKKIGLFTSGGDAPGMNAAVRAVTRKAIIAGLEVVGIKRGYEGMIQGELLEMNSYSVANIIQKVCTILKSSRSEAFRTKEGRLLAYRQLKEAGIEGLVCIGGNGSYAGAKVLYEETNIPCIGIPGTIDNDLFGTDYTIGFHTAVQNAVEAIDKIRDTADSHDRTFFIEVMGRDSGNLAMHVGLSVGAEAVLIPEIKHDFDYLIDKFSHRRKKKGFSIIVVAEGDEEGGAHEIAKKFKERFPNTEEKVTILGHLQRGGSPAPQDRILASKLGWRAVDFLLERKCGALGLVNNQFNFISFDEAIDQTKKPDTQLWDIDSEIS